MEIQTMAGSIDDSKAQRGKSPTEEKAGVSRYEAQKRRDWNTFGQYLKNHRPPLPLGRCSGAHVLEFLRYLDQFGKTKVHAPGCPFFGQPQPPAPCVCPLRQAWGSLDALVGRLRAAYEENGGKAEVNPFGARAVQLYLREVRQLQAKARGITYDKKKRKRTSSTAKPSRQNGGPDCQISNSSPNISTHSSAYTNTTTTTTTTATSSSCSTATIPERNHNGTKSFMLDTQQQQREAASSSQNGSPPPAFLPNNSAGLAFALNAQQQQQQQQQQAPSSNHNSGSPPAFLPNNSSHSSTSLAFLLNAQHHHQQQQQEAPSSTNQNSSSPPAAFLPNNNSSHNGTSLAFLLKQQQEAPPSSSSHRDSSPPSYLPNTSNHNSTTLAFMLNQQHQHHQQQQHQQHQQESPSSNQNGSPPPPAFLPNTSGLNSNSLAFALNNHHQQQQHQHHQQQQQQHRYASHLPFMFNTQQEQKQPQTQAHSNSPPPSLLPHHLSISPFASYPNPPTMLRAPSYNQLPTSTTYHQHQHHSSRSALPYDAL